MWSMVSIVLAIGPGTSMRLMTLVFNREEGCGLQVQIAAAGESITGMKVQVHLGLLGQCM